MFKLFIKKFKITEPIKIYKENCKIKNKKKIIIVLLLFFLIVIITKFVIFLFK